MLIGMKFLWDVRNKKFSDFDKAYLKKKMKLLMFENTLTSIFVFTSAVILIMEFVGWEPLLSSKWRPSIIVLLILGFLWDIIATIILERKIFDSNVILKSAKKRKESLLTRYIWTFMLFVNQVIIPIIFGLVYFFLFASLKGYSFFCFLSIPRLFYLNTRLPKFYKIMDELYELEEISS